MHGPTPGEGSHTHALANSHSLTHPRAYTRSHSLIPLSSSKQQTAARTSTSGVGPVSSATASGSPSVATTTSPPAGAAALSHHHASADVECMAQLQERAGAQIARAQERLASLWQESGGVGGGKASSLWAKWKNRV